METKTLFLPYRWTVVIHETYHLYTNQEDQYAFAVLDEDLETVIAFSVNDSSVRVSSCRYDVKQTINVSTRVITIDQQPVED
ncbi:hypothetical protein BpJC7_28510 [Weizmannia acidilactici]|uniref:Uncharacterized protein n=1 Tax=Weizmannia acidilactici TaxID=2607726 RepID=A0A5J4JLV9_9BACI|nr:hypothetical protein [Weizmannia acidilactici]GER67924.1 hypothetical protein BpJC4_23950 [Weizmannia acidilactici]GER71548.1 hypothetical protein BpJC7_28510 [Weizmannia acidilactici]GER73839.1 hypothetical protein BpPP18_19060 [Weizmannia acidilactici]